MCEMMKCQLLCSDEFTELAKAMIKVQQALRPASKDSYNDYTKSKYATLGSVQDACRDALIENGIWVTQFPVNVGMANTLGLVTKLVHIDSAQWQSSLLVMPLPKNDPQGYGSALTYARRYGLCALVGIVTEDDDGSAASILGSNHDSSITTQGHDKMPSFSPKKATKGASSGNHFTKNQKHDNGVKSKNERQTSQSQMTGNEQVKLPKIDGVVFKSMKSNGKDYITATGNTHAKKAILKQAGFRWEPKQKLWWRGVAT